MTSEVAGFLETLYETDRKSHTLVNQAIPLCWSVTAPQRGDRWWTQWSVR